jgi:type IV pilus assembly protein PilX
MGDDMSRNNEKGFVLVVCLVFLAILTLVAVFMFNGLTQDERIAGNNREKNRALDASQTSLDLSKTWMGAGNVYTTGDWVTGVDCSTATVTVNTPVVCSTGTVPGSPTDPSTWTTYSTYAPASFMNVNAGGGANNYASSTKFIVEYLGATSANPPTAIYQVTSAATGGNANAVTVVRAVYNVQSLSRDIGGG